ncbi:hypothetical protein FSOLCH5_001480 [Fusarium solani]
MTIKLSKAEGKLSLCWLRGAVPKAKTTLHFQLQPPGSPAESNSSRLTPLTLEGSWRSPPPPHETTVPRYHQTCGLCCANMHKPGTSKGPPKVSKGEGSSSREGIQPLAVLAS